MHTRRQMPPHKRLYQSLTQSPKWRTSLQHCSQTIYIFLGSNLQPGNRMWDKQRASNKTSIGNQKMDAWNRLLMRFGVRDAFNIGAFRRKSTKTFTWTDAHNDDSMVQSRIDRIYIPTQMVTIGRTTKILPKIPNISCHSRVLMHLINAGLQKP